MKSCISYAQKNIKKSCKNNKFKISASTYNDKYELCDRSYSVSDIQDYKTDNPWIRIYINKIKNRITFKVQAGYYLDFLTPETMKLLGSTKSKITKDENGENVPHLELTEVVIVNCNFVNNDYQHDSRVLYKFIPNTSLG